MMAWSGLDKRNFPRVQARCDIWINEGSSTVIKTRTENVGGGGVCVILKQELEKFSNVRLQLTLTEGSTPLESGGRIVWVVPSSDPATHKVSYDTGIEFLGLMPEDQETIVMFTETFV